MFRTYSNLTFGSAQALLTKDLCRNVLLFERILLQTVILSFVILFGSVCVTQENEQNILHLSDSVAMGKGSNPLPPTATHVDRFLQV